MLEIKIHNYKYKIIFAKEKDERLLMEDGSYHSGVTDFIKKEIYIREDLSDQALTYTINHEITHAIIDSYGMLQVEWNDEIVADFIAVHLQTFQNIFEQINEQDKKNKSNDFYKILEKSMEGEK